MSLYDNFSPKSRIVFNLLTVPWFVLCFYWLFTYSGPAKVVSDFQAQYNNGLYYGALTFLVLFLPVMFFVVGICFFVDFTTKAGVFKDK